MFKSLAIKYSKLKNKSQKPKDSVIFDKVYNFKPLICYESPDRNNRSVARINYSIPEARQPKTPNEACPDYATQTLNQSTGLYEVAEPNIVKVYAGKAKLKSPIELAVMYKKKIDGPLEHNNVAESIAQLKKGVQVYDKLVKGYQKQGLLVKSPEPKFRLAMEIISWAPDDYRATTDVIQKLNNLLSTETGFSDVNAFSHDLIMRLGNF